MERERDRNGREEMKETETERENRKDIEKGGERTTSYWVSTK